MKYRVVPGGRGEWLNVNGKLKVGWALREGELSHMCVALPTDTNSDVWRCHQNLVLFSHPPSTSFTRSGRRKSGLGTMRQRGLELTAIYQKEEYYIILYYDNFQVLPHATATS